MVSSDTVADTTTREGLVHEGSSNSNNAPELSNIKLVLYALPSIPIAFLFMPMTLLLPAYYAGTMHVSLAAVGGFLLASRLGDVVLDPMIGKWSDTSRSKFGRRKFWMAIGTPILMLGSFLLFMPMVPVSGWYLLVVSFILYAGASCVTLPYSAWGTDIVETYHGRSRMAGFRETAGVLGWLMAAMVPAITGLFGHGVDRFTMSIMGWMIIVLTPLTIWIATRYVYEPVLEKRVFVPWWPSLVALFKNKPFRLFCLAYVIFTMGGSIGTATLVFFMSDYLGQPELVGPGLFLLAISTAGFVPFWVWLARRIGKHRAAAASLIATVVVHSSGTPFLEPGQGWIYVGLLAAVGGSMSGYVTLPISIIGDIIDYDTLMHREPRGGIFWGIWSFAQKLSPALGIGIALPLLSFLGFNPGVENTDAALDALRLTYWLAPLPSWTVGALLLFYFPIEARRHGIIRRRLEQRQERSKKT